MTYLYQFTDDERRYIQEAHKAYMQRLANIAEIHNLQGNVKIAEDLSGFLSDAE